jgi:hypothetical protein
MHRRYVQDIQSTISYCNKRPKIMQGLCSMRVFLCVPNEAVSIKLEGCVLHYEIVD